MRQRGSAVGRQGDGYRMGRRGWGRVGEGRREMEWDESGAVLGARRLPAH